MTIGKFGSGFLNSDPRKGKHPTGGSIHAAQPSDTSVLITGNPGDSIGYANKDAFATGNEFSVRAKPDYQKTAAETVAHREASGIAKSHLNMGSLAVDFRKSEEGKRKAGEQTDTSKRATKILDQRAAAEHTRLVEEPAAAEARKFRTQAAAAKDYMGSFMAKGDRDMNRAKARTFQRSNTSLFNGSKRGGGLSSNYASGKTMAAGNRGGLDLGPNFSGIGPQAQSDFDSIRGEDPMAIAATRAHSLAPGTQSKSAADMANAQSASGKATPIEMAQAMASQSYRNNPNKP
jgi:hypothetical protein